MSIVSRDEFLRRVTELGFVLDPSLDEFERYEQMRDHLLADGSLERYMERFTSSTTPLQSEPALQAMAEAITLSVEQAFVCGFVSAMSHFLKPTEH